MPLTLGFLQSMAAIHLLSPSVGGVKTVMGAMGKLEPFSLFHEVCHVVVLNAVALLLERVHC